MRLLSCGAGIAITLVIGNLVPCFCADEGHKATALPQRVVLIDQYPNLINNEIRLFPAGKLISLDGVEITEKNIKDIFIDSKIKDVGFYVILSVAEKDKTSFTTMASTIRRIFASVNPNVTVTIFLMDGKNEKSK